jgi:hypothetical protein
LPIIQRHKYMDVSDIMHLIRKDQKEGKLNLLQASIASGHRPAEAVFNIRTDPWETNNLAVLPAYQNILKELRNANQEAILKNRDVLFAPEYVLAQTDQTDTLYQYRNDQNKYPLEAILKTAETVGMGKVFLKKQKDLLKDKNSIVRYWAVIGLHNQDKKALNERELLTALQNEREPFVKIEIASLLADDFNSEEAKVILLNLLGDKNAPLVRQALRAVINSVSVDKAFTDRVILLRKDTKEHPFKTFNYEINSCIDLILDSAGIEKLSNEE